MLAPRSALLLSLVLPSLCASIGIARADYPTRVGTRALGMGGALRASATGDAGPMLNPAGISLIRAYVVEGAYQLDSEELPGGAGRDRVGHRAHVSVTDSTPQSRLGGAAYYTYLNARPAAGIRDSGHQAGAALALPLGDHLSLGVTLKYLTLMRQDEDAPAPANRTRSSGFTLDAGAVLRPMDGLGLAVVGYNLIERDTPLLPRAVGWGAAYSPVPALLMTFDGVTDFDSRRFRTGVDRAAHSFMGGVEYVLPAQAALRAGGGYDGVRDRTYLAAGVSGVSEVGAIDIGLQRDVSGATKQTIFAASVRLFVPNP